MAVQEQKERYLVSITTDLENPPAIDVKISWQEDTKLFTETRKYPSPQELRPKVGREKLLRTIEQFAGATLTIGGLGEAIVATALLNRNLGELNPYLQIGAYVLGIGTAVAGGFIGRDGTVQYSKVSAIQRQINRVLRPVYTVELPRETPPLP